MSTAARWQPMRLDECFWFQEGPGVRKWQFRDSGIKLLNVANIEKSGRLNLDKTDRYLEQSEVSERYSHFLIDEGDLVIASSGISFDEDGLLRTRGAFVHKEHLPLCLNTSTIRFKSKEGLSDSSYLKHWLNSHAFRQQITKLVTGSAQQNFGPSHLKAIKIDLPPLPEQRRIAAILDKADALRTKLREALAQLDRLAQSIFVEMFGDPVTNPKGWPRVSLGELIASGPQNGLYKPASDYGSGVPILRIDAFYDGVVTGLATLKRLRVDAKEMALYGLNENEIVINRVNSPEYLGKSALIPPLPEPVVFESNMMRFALKTEQVVPRYVIAFLQTGFVKMQIRTASKDAVNQSSINQQDVKGFLIGVPPLSLQQTFADRLAEVEKLRIRQAVAISETEQLFSSLQHRAFRGEL